MNKDLLHGKILDYGCGHGYDLLYIRHKGYNAIGYDKYNETYNNKEVLKYTYDIVICNYVFNVIKDLYEHKELVQLLKSIGDEVYISVRNDVSSIKPNWIYINEYDCYLTSKGSYQRFYNKEMINKYFGKVEYIVNNNSFKLFKIK